MLFYRLNITATRAPRFLPRPINLLSKAKIRCQFRTGFISAAVSKLESNLAKAKELFCSLARQCNSALVVHTKEVYARKSKVETSKSKVKGTQ
jgi:hypothetical protein